MLSKLDALRHVAMFASVSEPVLQEILAGCHEKVYMKGETLFVERDPPRGLMVLWRGGLKIYKLGDSGREQILDIVMPGGSVAELPLLDGMPYPASCQAMEDAIVLEMPVAAFHRLVERHPELSRAIIASLSMRLRRMVGLVEEISLKAVRERFVGFLLELAGDADTFELTLTNQDIASRIGTVREIVSRSFSRLVHEGAIRLEGRTVTILDRKRLA